MLENFGDKRNTNGLDKNPSNINKAGRKPSLKKQLSEIITEDGYITFDIKDCTITDKTVTVQVTRERQIAAKLIEWAMSSKGSDSIKAIQLILEHLDGKPKQSVEISEPIEIKPAFWSDDLSED